jgi:hypothetical protein
VVSDAVAWRVAGKGARRRLSGARASSPEAARATTRCSRARGLTSPERASDRHKTGDRMALLCARQPQRSDSAGSPPLQCDALVAARSSLPDPQRGSSRSPPTRVMVARKLFTHPFAGHLRPTVPFRARSRCTLPAGNGRQRADGREDARCWQGSRSNHSGSA